MKRAGLLLAVASLLVACASKPPEQPHLGEWKVGSLEREGVIHGPIAGVAVDSSGNVWFASNHGAVNRYNPAAAAGEPAWRFYNVVARTVDAVQIAADGRGGVWLLAQMAVYHYDPATDAWRAWRKDPLPSDGVTAIAARGDEVWLLSLRTLFRYRIGDDRLESIDRSTGVSAALKVAVTVDIPMRLALDGAGRPWLIRANLVCGLLAADAFSCRAITGLDALELGPVRAAAVERDGTIWMASGRHFLRLGPDYGKWTRVDSGPNVPAAASITTAVIDDAGLLRVGTRDGTIHERVSPNGEWRLVLPKTTTLHTAIVSFLPQASGGVWAVTSNSAANLPAAGGAWTNREHSVVQPFRGIRLLSLERDSDGLIWIGTDSGLFRIDPVNGAWISGIGSPLLSGDSIGGVADDGRGHLWVLASGVINRLDPQTGNAQKSFPAAEGLLGIGGATGVVSDRRGGAWFAASRSMLRFDPAADSWSLLFNAYSSVNTLAVNGQGDVCAAMTAGHLSCRTARGEIVELRMAITSGPVADGGNGFWIGHPGGVSVEALEAPPQHDYPLGSPVLSEMRETSVLAVDPRSRALWAFTPSHALRYQQGQPLQAFALPMSGRITRAVIDDDGAAWIGDDSHLARMVPELPGSASREIGARVLVSDRFPPTLLSLGSPAGAGEPEVITTNTPSGMAWLRAREARVESVVAGSDRPNGAEPTVLSPGPSGQTWIGTKLSGLLLRADHEAESAGALGLTKKTGLPSMSINALSVVPGSGGTQVWVATQGGPCRVQFTSDEKSNRLQVALVPAPDVVPFGPADGIAAASDGSAYVAFSAMDDDWFADRAGQRAAARTNTTIWRLVPKADGKGVTATRFGVVDVERFNGAQVRELALDEKHGRLWIATSAGLFRGVLGSKSGSYVVAESGDNQLQPAPIRHLGVAPDTAGTLWMAVEGGEGNPDYLLGYRQERSELTTLRLPPEAHWNGVIEGMAFSANGDLVVSSAGHYFRGPVFVPDRTRERLVDVAWIVGLVVFYSGFLMVVWLLTRGPRALLARIVENPSVLPEVPLPQLGTVVRTINVFAFFARPRRLFAGSPLESPERRRLVAALSQASARPSAQLEAVAALVAAKPAGDVRLVAPGLHLLSATFSAPDPLRDRRLALLFLQPDLLGAADAGRRIIEEALQQAAHPVEYPLLVLCREGDVPADAIPPAYSTLTLGEPELRALALARAPAQALAGLLFTNGLLTTALSPYSVSGEVKKSMFFGRADLLKRMVESPEKRFIVVGPRRVGKTSLLRRLEEALADRNPDARAIFVSFWNQRDAAWLVKAAGEALGCPFDPSAPPDEQLAAVLREHARRGGVPPVLLIDEADRFVRADAEAGFPTLAAMRRLQDERACSFVLAGFQWLQRETRDQRSPLFNFANVITLGALDRDAARRLAEQPLAERLGVRYADAALPDRVVDRTGAYPSFVQLLCDQILRQLKGGELVITAAHIQQAEETEEVRNALRDVFRQNVPPIGRVVAFRLLEVDEFTLPDVDRVIAEATGKRVRLEIAEEVAAQLCLFGFLVESQGRFRWAMPMLRDSLRSEGYAADRLAEELPDDPANWLELSESR